MHRHAGEGLELPGGEAEPFAGVVAEPGEAEGVLSLLPQEGRRQRAEDAAAACLLPGEAPEVAVEEERALATVEVGMLIAAGWLQQLGRHEIDAGRDRGGWR